MLAERLQRAVRHAGDRFSNAKPGWPAERVLIVVRGPQAAAVPHEQRWLVDLASGTVEPTGDGTDEADWSMVGSPGAWQAVLTGKANLSTEVRQWRLRYSDPGDSPPFGARPGSHCWPACLRRPAGTACWSGGGPAGPAVAGRARDMTVEPRTTTRHRPDGRGAPAGDGKAGPRGEDATGHGPLVVLNSLDAGADRVLAVLSGHPDLACMPGTGLLPLCEQAAVAWGRVEGGGGMLPSPLAAASIRSMVSAMAVTLRARTGRRRWCEFSVAAPSAAAALLAVYPDTRLVCLYRSCPDFVRAALDASPWGLASRPSRPS